MTLRRTRHLDEYIAIKELSEEHDGYPVSEMCRILQVNRAAYYKWKNHGNSRNDAFNELICRKAEQIHSEHPDMGYRRIRDTLAHDYGINVNDKRVLRICRKKKIQSYVKHRYNCCTRPASDPAYVAGNILSREFKSDRPNEKWVKDEAEFKYGTGEDDKKGKLYPSVILDLCGNRPVSYGYGDHNDNRIVFNTFDKALLADPGAKPVFHSDRGYQYTSKTFQRKIADAGMTQGMSRVGRCIDNGPMEGFWGIMKREMYYGRKYKTKEALIKAIEDYIDYYTNKRVQRFKASAAIPRIYRLKFQRDIYKDLRILEKSIGEGDEENSNMDLFSLEMFENIAYTMAKHADPQIPGEVDEWLDGFNTFSIYQVLPQLIELWGLNVKTDVEAKKNFAQLSGK